MGVNIIYVILTVTFTVVSKKMSINKQTCKQKAYRQKTIGHLQPHKINTTDQGQGGAELVTV